MTQLKEGLRIAQKFPMEYPQLQNYRERINTFLLQVSNHLTMGQAVSEAQLRDDFNKIKSIAEMCMNKQILDKMKKHHLALKRQHYEQQQAAASAAAAATGRGSAGLGSVLAGSAADELIAARNTLKAKVMKLLPIRQHIKAKLESAPHVPSQFKRAYTTIRKKIERIAKYYTEECKTLAHVAKCTQYLHATYGEWKHLIATHQEWLKNSNGQPPQVPPPAGVPGPPAVGATNGHASTQAAQAQAQAQAQAVAVIKAHMRASVKKLRELYDSYKQMLEFRSATKAKEAGSDAVSDEDKTLFTDEVNEVKQLQSVVHSILQRANTSAVRLPDGVTKRIEHLDYSLRLRQQFVLYRQLHTLEKCASWCANAKGGEWYLQLQEPVNKLIAEIAMLKRSKVPSPHTPSVFHKFLNFRKQAAQHQRAGATSPGAGASATPKLTSADAKKSATGTSAKSRKNNVRSYGAAMALVGQQMGLGPPTGAGAPVSGKQSAAASKKAAAAAKRAAAAKKKSEAARKRAADAAAARKKRAEAAAATKASKAAAAAAKKARGNGGRSPSAATTAALKRKKAAAAAAAKNAATSPSPDLKRRRAAGSGSGASAALSPVRTGQFPPGMRPTTGSDSSSSVTLPPVRTGPVPVLAGAPAADSPFLGILQQLKRRKEEEDAAKSGRPSN